MVYVRRRVWTAAGLSAAIGCGLWQMGLLGGLLTLITLSGVKRINQSMGFKFGHTGKTQTQEKVTIFESDEDD